MLRRGRHPITGVFLGSPIPEHEWDTDAAAGEAELKAAPSGIAAGDDAASRRFEAPRLRIFSKEKRAQAAMEQSIAPEALPRGAWGSGAAPLATREIRAEAMPVAPRKRIRGKARPF